MSLDPNLRVLVVEDNDYSRISVCHFLKSAGVVAIEEAVDGEEAIDKTLAQPFDLIICDIFMKPMDGWSFIDHLREQGDTTPVIVLTGHEDGEMREKAYARDAVAFIGKPVSKRRLIARVSEAVAAEQTES